MLSFLVNARCKQLYFTWEFYGDCRLHMLICCCFTVTAKILPVVKNQHLLLCTLLICNAASMEVHIVEISRTRYSLYALCFKKRLANFWNHCSFVQALPIFLDSLVTAWGAILISVTLILLFGEVRYLSDINFVF